MAEPQVQIGSGSNPVDEGDVEMQGGDNGGDVVEVAETGAAAEGVPDQEEKPTQRDAADRLLTQYRSYLKSPMVELLIGSGDSQTLLMAHKALLQKSPFFSEKLASSSSTRIELGDDDLDAVSCFLEYLYTGEYFPHKLPSGSLEHDPSAPKIDDSGAQLLKHARVYTLAEKLVMPVRIISHLNLASFEYVPKLTAFVPFKALKSLSHSKIHLITSTAIAEIAYARYVYSHTTRSDLTIRKPVASFWGQRSHVLRHETEGSFRDMCLAFPEFAFDVLSFVLDAEERRAQRRGDDEVGKSARKRARGA
ncbi:MAG: hypothetical protein Q9211_003099 [Gyalolechia sp. 1 TL-2023]